MYPASVEWSSETEQAEWIRPRLHPFGHLTVGSIVPTGFEACARLLHPAGSSSGRTVRWSEVAAWSGTLLQRDSRFHEIALPAHTPPAPVPCDEHGPEEGTLTEQDAVDLVAVLGEHTTTPQNCWFCLWDGHGWDSGARYVRIDEGTVLPDTPPPPSDDPVPAWVRAGPRVRFPNRDYLLYTGPAEAALAFVPDKEQTPNLWWPADRSWCVATELDNTETYLAGSHTLIEQVLGHPRLEALPAHPDDTVASGLRGWHAEVVEAAVTELLTDGVTTMRTARGTAHATLARPDRSRRGYLHVRFLRPEEDGANTSMLDCSDEERIRHKARFALTHALLDLAAG